MNTQSTGPEVPRHAISSYLGHMIDLVDSRDNQYPIEDIAHSLAAMPRFAGHTRDLYSVAQHSVWVSRHLPAPLALHGLLHDAPRAYMMDMLGPVKRNLYEYGRVETALHRSIVGFHGLDPNLAKVKLISAIDDLALFCEWRDLKDSDLESWWHVNARDLDDLDPIEPLNSADAEQLFLERFHEILSGRYSQHESAAAQAACRKLKGAVPSVQSRIHTFTGKAISLDRLKPSDIDIHDIATSLSRMPRFCGHTRVPYSVAQHSLFVAERAAPGNKLKALLHDADEAYLMDVASPIKPLFPGYKDLEHAVQRVILQAFNVDATDLKPADIKAADTLSMLAEQRDLMNSSQGWWKPDLDGCASVPTLIPMPDHEVKQRFIEAFEMYNREANPDSAPTNTAPPRLS